MTRWRSSRRLASGSRIVSRCGRVAMPIRRRATEAGILKPAELDLLGRVFEQLRLAGQSQEAREAIASRIIANYMAGPEQTP